MPQLAVLTLVIMLASGCAGVQSRFHRVKSGDTWNAIAGRYSVPLKDLQAANEDSETLKAGDKIYIPFEENPAWNARALKRELAKTAPPEELEDIRPEKVDGKVDYSSPLVRYVWPVSGKLSSKFGRRKGSFHEGIDISAPEGMNVRASRSGHVIYSSNQISGYGNLVIVRHADGFSTVYAHLSKRLVKRGQFIAKGTVLGKVGMTGRASSPHLHFEVRKGQLPVNPMQFLQNPLLAKK